ncbi:MAG: DUF1254 domain-containing protein [Rhodopila sp.]|nr:DUF1254 domain-containing protein [Rhodopila sp.]
MAVTSMWLAHLALPTLLCAAMISVPPRAVFGADTVTEQDAHAIGVSAYVYFYPLVTMDITRKQLTNVSSPAGLQTPMNTFANAAEYPTADMKVVVRPNFDTLYSSAWLDLTKEPMVVSVPDTHGRYYLLPMLDIWTDVFASPGWRTTGTQAGDYAVVPPGWTGSLPAGVTRIDAPTPYVWVIGRTKTDGPADYAAVHQIQAGYKITPISQWGKAVAPVVGTVDPGIDMKTPPKTQVDTMPAGKFFAYAAEVLKSQPPHITDEPILAQMRRIGIERGKSFAIDKLDPAIKTALETVPEDAMKLMAWKVRSIARVENGWSMNTDTMGVYGNYYLKRAIVAQLGLGANLPEDAIYPLNLADETGKPLDGSNAYILHFEKGGTPPVDAFWSITLYDPEGFQVGNVLNRFAVSSWMPFKYNPDGSLDLYFENERPGADKEANWLPAPKGPFNLTMRLYAPKSDALTGKWNPPPVMKAAAPPTLSPQ